MTVIKEVGNVIIELRESAPNWLSYVFSLVVGVVGIVVSNMTIISVAGITTTPVYYGLFVYLPILGLFALVSYLYVSDIGCYVVSGGGEWRFISKTTPEADQIAICKAAKDIESRLLEIQTREDAKKARLEEIARRCK